jgi:hypothetical protein
LDANLLPRDQRKDEQLKLLFAGLHAIELNQKEGMWATWLALRNEGSDTAIQLVSDENQ